MKSKTSTYAVVSSMMAALAIGAYVEPVYASTDLADAPMAVVNQAKPAVIFTLDNSAGVDVDSIFESYNGMYYETGVSVDTSVLNGMWNLYPNINSKPSTLQIGGPTVNPDRNSWRAFYHGFNLTFYNSSITYKPWPGNDDRGVPFSDASPTAVRLRPYFTNSETYDLTKWVNGFTAYTYLNYNGVGCYSGGCKTGHSYPSSVLPASFYEWNDKNHNGVMDSDEGVRYEIVPGTPGYPSGRSYVDELRNFANWFQYFRTPFLASKGAIGSSVASMSSVKAGFVDLVQLRSPAVDISIPANLNSFRNQVYGLDLTGNMSNNGAYYQPLHERMQFVWNYLNLPAGSSNPPAPIEFACQQNFNVLVSPGYINENAPWGNQYTGATPSGISPKNYDGSWAAPYADSFSDTLADWSAYYYDKRLRADLTAGKVPLPLGTQESNQNLHLSTFVLAPGASPVLSSQDPTGPLGDPQNVNLFPPVSTPITWPQPVFVAQSTIDDMWHMAVNGRGKFVNSADIAAGLSTIVDNILGRSGSSAAVAVANAHITSVDNASYATSYNSGTWTGNLNAYPIDLGTGLPDVNHPIWTSSAQEQLDSSTPSTRKVATYDGTKGVQFQPTTAVTDTKITSAQQTSMNSPSKLDGDKVVAYIRGDSTYEGPTFRARPHLLGDIVNAEPAFVGTPSANYLDDGYATATVGFKALKSSRSKMVYQAANDGMLHAFVAATGAEAWAYVPSFAISQLNYLTRTPGFAHKYFVDSTPATSDADFGNVGGSVSSPDWRTILVGGMGKGGRGYYALDITSPAAAGESAVASKVLWEFPNSSTSGYSASIGYTFGKPIVVKTASSGWVVLVSSGYNNGADTGGDGKGYLFVLNAKTGSVIKAIPTGVGTAANPSGLSSISAYVENADVDNTADFVYGGDLAGNVWRFDLRGAVSTWSVQKLAALVDSSASAQPITTAPELARLTTNNGFKRMVYVGTGRYLGNSDVSSAIGTQTVYGLIDDESATPLISPLRSKLQQQTFVLTSGTERTASGNTVDYVNKKGWFIDLPVAGERISTDPILGQSVLAVVSNIPSSDPCTPGGSSWINFLDFRTGGKVDNSATVTSTYLGNVLGSRPVLVKLPSGEVKALVRQSDANTKAFSTPTSTPVSGVRRISWREIPDS